MTAINQILHKQRRGSVLVDLMAMKCSVIDTTLFELDALSFIGKDAIGAKSWSLDDIIPEGAAAMFTHANHQLADRIEGFREHALAELTVKRTDDPAVLAEHDAIARDIRDFEREYLPTLDDLRTPVRSESLTTSDLQYAKEIAGRDDKLAFTILRIVAVVELTFGMSDRSKAKRVFEYQVRRLQLRIRLAHADWTKLRSEDDWDDFINSEDDLEFYMKDDHNSTSPWFANPVEETFYRSLLTNVEEKLNFAILIRPREWQAEIDK